MTWKYGQHFRVRTKRFLLRPLQEADITDEHLNWWADAEIAQGINEKQEPMSREQAVKLIQKADNARFFNVGVFDREDGNLVGVHYINYSPRHQTADLHVIIGDRRYWGAKVVREIREGLLEFLFFYVKAYKAYGRPIARNVSAVFNYKAQGFRCEAVLKEHVVALDGTRLDQYTFAVTRPEWEKLRKGANNAG